MRVRRAMDRGLTQLSWLYSRHSFSFGDYYDPKNMGFRSLRVINDDIIARGTGFGMHGHRDMEIITLVIDGELEHKDSLGHGEVLRPGEVQVMTAGRGIRHSEFNPSGTKDAHIIQIWIEPRELSLQPAYAQKEFPLASRSDRLIRVAGPHPTADGALAINQDAHVFLASLAPQKAIHHTIRPGRAAWIHLIKGSCAINGTTLVGGDAVAIESQGDVTITGHNEPCDLVLFDLP